MATTDAGAPSAIDSESTSNASDFGANEWLVEDMYERYLADPSSVDAAWHDFFADFRGGTPAAEDGPPAVTPPPPPGVPAPAAAAPLPAATTANGATPAAKDRKSV
ncbi:hypothetical protein, partial [Jatrophihabitans sp.]|uniref:2-oxoglutarate dehydrogenase E1 subunit family protein n=1 Tax=Jatrophihabitans sp. TaxID=1932789 RepID=UPI0030C7587E|nr:kgd [Jatrophihabitans sp.]